MEDTIVGNVSWTVGVRGQEIKRSVRVSQYLIAVMVRNGHVGSCWTCILHTSFSSYVLLLYVISVTPLDTMFQFDIPQAPGAGVDKVQPEFFSTLVIILSKIVLETVTHLDI